MDELKEYMHWLIQELIETKRILREATHGL